MIKKIRRYAVCCLVITIVLAGVVIVSEFPAPQEKKVTGYVLVAVPLNPPGYVFYVARAFKNKRACKEKADAYIARKNYFHPICYSLSLSESPKCVVRWADANITLQKMYWGAGGVWERVYGTPWWSNVDTCYRS